MKLGIPFAALLALGCGVVMAAPAAQTGGAPTPAPQPAAAVASRGAPATSAPAKRSVPPVDSSMCIRDTGSLIKPPKGQCLPVAGNSYTQEQLRSTGQLDVGRALQMLDPSVRIGH